MAVQPAGDRPVNNEANRPVWVENLWDADYEETYRGEKILVPAKGKILMPNLRANRFLSNVHGNYEILPNGQYRGVPKALRIVELTDEERAEVQGKSVKEVKVEKEAEAKRLMCVQCEFTTTHETGLKNHITRMHSE